MEYFSTFTRRVGSRERDVNIHGLTFSRLKISPAMSTSTGITSFVLRGSQSCYSRQCVPIRMGAHLLDWMPHPPLDHDKRRRRDRGFLALLTRFIVLKINMKLSKTYMPALSIPLREPEVFWNGWFAMVNNTGVYIICCLLRDCDKLRSILTRQFAYVNPVDGFTGITLTLVDLELNLQTVDVRNQVWETKMLYETSQKIYSWLLLCLLFQLLQQCYSYYHYKTYTTVMVREHQADFRNIYKLL